MLDPGTVREGVIKFEARHRQEPVGPALVTPVLAELLGWRQLLWRLGLVGQDPARYLGAAYGNVSARLAPEAAPAWQRPFLVTATQTSGRAALCADNLCVVLRCDAAANRVESYGKSLPSSEAMTHAAVYAARHSVRWVFHVHAPELWRAARALDLPRTRAGVDYGTPEMASEVKRLVAHAARDAGVLAMDGHEDGMVAFGPTAGACGSALLTALARAIGRSATASS